MMKRSISKCGLSVQSLMLFSFAILLAPFFVLFNGPSASAAANDFVKCTIPLETYTDFGERAAQRYGGAENYNSYEFKFVGVCHGSGEIQIHLVNKEAYWTVQGGPGIYNQSYDKLYNGSYYGIGTLWAAYTSDGTFTGWNQTNGSNFVGVMETESSGSGFKYSDSDVTNKDQSFIDGGFSIPSNVHEPKKKLQFSWSVTDSGKLDAIYLQNVTNDMLNNCGITWKLEQSNIDWDTDTTIETITQQKNMVYTKSGITPGFYKLTAKIASCVPFIDDGSIEESTVRIAYNGSFIAGNSDAGGNSQTPFAESSTILNSFGLTQAVQAPLNAINNLQSSSCSPVTLPLFSGSNIVLPCLSQFYSSTLPVFFGIWQISITGVLGYWFAVNMLAHIKKLLNPQNDSIEVVNL